MTIFLFSFLCFFPLISYCWPFPRSFTKLREPRFIVTSAKYNVQTCETLVKGNVLIPFLFSFLADRVDLLTHWIAQDLVR